MCVTQLHHQLCNRDGTTQACNNAKLINSYRFGSWRQSMCWIQHQTVPVGKEMICSWTSTPKTPVPYRKEKNQHLKKKSNFKQLFYPPEKYKSQVNASTMNEKLHSPQLTWTSIMSLCNQCSFATQLQTVSNNSCFFVCSSFMGLDLLPHTQVKIHPTKGEGQHKAR